MCVLETRCSCLWFAWNRHLHSRNHSWRCPGRRRAGFPSHQSSELCMTGARPQIHRSRQERLCALFLLGGCVASHLVLLSGSSSSCAEDRKKHPAYARCRPPADRAQTGTLQATMPGIRVQVGTAPFAHVVLAASAFGVIRCVDVFSAKLIQIGVNWVGSECLTSAGDRVPRLTRKSVPPSTKSHCRGFPGAPGLLLWC